MSTYGVKRLAALLVMAAAIALILTSSSGASSSGGTVDWLDRGQGPSPAILRWDPENSTHRVPAPRFVPRNGIQSTSFVINFIADGTKDAMGSDCFEWPTEAKLALNHAAAIWAALIDSPVPIEIDACWADLGPGVLGYGGANKYVLRGNSLYPIALANAVFNSDLNGDDAEINVTYSRKFDWHWGTDGNPPLDKIDFVTVVLHEICHGLGFSGSMHVASGLGYWGFGILPFPTDYDRHAESGSGQSLLGYEYGSPALAAALTSNDVFFDGPHTNAANDGSPAKLFAPGAWLPGSSYAHLDEVFNGTDNALMTYALSSGESLHHPGQVSLGIFQDIGWQLTQPPHDLELIMENMSGRDLAPGDPVTYTIGLRNLGPGAAVQMVVTNVLSSQVTSVSWSSSPSLGDVVLEYDSTFVWKTEGLQSGGSGVITVTGSIDPGLSAYIPIANAALTTAQGFDANVRNNRDAIVFGGQLTFLPLAVSASY